MRTASRIGSLGALVAAFSRSASWVEKSRSLLRPLAPDLMPVSIGAPDRGPASAERRDLLQQFVRLDRLADVVARALAQGPDAIGLLVLAGADDDRDRLRGRVLGQRARELETVL